MPRLDHKRGSVYYYACVYVFINGGKIVNAHELESRIPALLDRLSGDLAIRYHKASGGKKRPDLIVELDAGGAKPLRVVVELCANPRPPQVLRVAEQASAYAAASKASPAVALPVLSPSLRRELRNRGVGYLSLDGQVYLSGRGVLIDRQVPNQELPIHRESGPSHFADRSSLLLRHMLAHGNLPSGVRSLAARLKVSPALVSRLLSKLRGEGIVIEEDGRVRIADKSALLEDWLDFYRRRARHQHEMRLYMHARDIDAVLRRLADDAWEAPGPAWGLSFQAGASLVAPYAFYSEVHVLVGGPAWESAALAIRQRLELEPAREQANIILVRPYYRESWAFGLRKIQGLPVVSDLQLYLDLSVYPRRGAEQAARIRERLLSSEASKDDG